MTTAVALATLPVTVEPKAVRIIRLLNREGVRGLDYLRLWGHFNDLMVNGVDRKLTAPVSLYLTATAHAYMAFVSLRKLLDTQPRAVSVGRMLDVVEDTMPALVTEMAQRGAELRMDEPQLRDVLSRHRDLLADLVCRAKPALTMTNRLIVHVDGQHVDNPAAMEKLLDKSKVSWATFASYYRDVQWIVNGWDLAWRGAQVHWDHPANRDDFAGIRTALEASHHGSPEKDSGGA